MTTRARNISTISVSFGSLSLILSIDLLLILLILVIPLFLVTRCTLPDHVAC